jgi:sugar/nucleoside kinase (ribokinase family)
MKKILCIAEACCDIIFGKLNKIPDLGEEEYCGYFSVKAGGGSNTPMGLAKLGVPTSFLTRLGDDEMGRVVLHCLMESGLDRKSFQLEKGIRTPVSAVMSTNKDRCFASFGGDGGPFVTEEQLEEAISQTDHVHTYLGYCLGYPIAELCRKYHKTLSLDTSWTELKNLSELEPVLSCCSLFTPNDKEAMALTGISSAEDALIILAAIVPDVVITMGEQGSMALVEGKIHHQECIRYGEAVDTTGAGDLYCSGLLYGFVNGKSLKEAMKIASHTAALCVTYYGGMDEAFSRDKLHGLL